MFELSFQALTNPEIFRLPIGQPAGKNQVAPIKIQVAPFAKPLVDDLTLCGKMKYQWILQQNNEK